MLMRTTELTIAQVSDLTHVSNKSIREWIRDEKLKAIRLGELGNFKVSAKFLADFLYQNPKYYKRFLANKPHAKNWHIKTMIKTDIEHRPKLYSSGDLTRIFSVTSETIRRWVKDGLLIPESKKATYSKYLFSRQQLTLFVEKCPRYKYVFEQSMKEETTYV